MSEVKLVPLDEFSAACRVLKGVYDYLIFVTAVDYPERGVLQLVYLLESVAAKAQLTLKVEIARKNPEMPSVAAEWPAAEWHEREIFDLFGVKFTDHPDLRRILLPPEWEGHPLRKDYLQSGVVKRPETLK